MKSHWRTSPWSGAVIGVVTAAAIAFLLRASQQALRSSLRSVEATESDFVLVAAFWLLFALGAALVGVVVAAQFHPLISAIPAAWFLIVFGPALFGVLGTPAWYPGWVRSYFLQTAGEAGPLVAGVLVVGTVVAYVRRRLSSSEPAGARVEEPRL